MTKILSLLAAAAMLPCLAVPSLAAVQVANSATSAFCGPDGAEGYKRPGGFCDQLDDNSTLAPSKDSECGPVADAGFRYDASLGMLVAVSYDPCCDLIGMAPDQLPVAGILVADVGCPI